MAMRRTDALLGLGVWLGTGLTLSTMGMGLKNLARVNQTRCRVYLSPAVSMPQPQDRPVASVEHVELPRAALDPWPEIAMHESRIFPEVRKGRTIGFRVSSVRPDGLIAAAGLRNDDVVLAINGYRVSSPDKAMLAYAKLRFANHYAIDIERQGRRMTLDLPPVPSPVRGGGLGRGQTLRDAAPAHPSPFASGGPRRRLPLARPALSPALSRGGPQERVTR
jgi:hypothetical protein